MAPARPRHDAGRDNGAVGSFVQVYVLRSAHRGSRSGKLLRNRSRSESRPTYHICSYFTSDASLWWCLGLGFRQAGGERTYVTARLFRMEKALPKRVCSSPTRSKPQAA